MLPSNRVHTAIRVALTTCALVVGLLGTAPSTPAQAAPKAPTGLAVASHSNNAVRLVWKPVSKAASYLVKYSSNSRFRNASYLRTAKPTAEIGKLKASRSYYFKVKALKASGKALTGYGKTKKVKTRSKKSYPVLSPAGLAATGINGDELTLGWTAQGSTNRYLVRRSTKKSMKSPKNRIVSGTSLLVDGLKRATPYYFTVEVISSKGKAISQRSGVRKATTAKLVTFGTPGGLAVSQVNPTQITVAWTPVRRAPLYQVAIAPGTWDETTYNVTGGTSVTVDGLIANTTYLVRLRVLDASGNPAGEFSPVIKATTPTAEAALRVASYNVHCHTCSPATVVDPAANDQPWTVRRDYVVDTIRTADPDVVALQEAQQSKLKSAGDTGLAQFEDLTKRLGPDWTLANPNRYNCTNPDSNSCTSAAPLTNTLQGASSGTKIVYRTDRLVLKGQGSMQLTPLSATSKQRFVAWAFLQQRSTGKKFLFADIHLEPGNDSDDVTVRDSWCGTQANPLCTLNRQVQARDALGKLAALNVDKLPIVLAGDAASSRAEVGGNLPYPIMTTQLVDPLGGMSYKAPAVAPAQTRINIAFNSVNKYDRLARRYAPGETTYNPASNNLYNGAYNDYILVSPAVRISEFEQVVNVDGTGRFVGVIPSDHNLIRATVWLP